jgi:SAM-dependent methyltransferase
LEKIGYQLRICEPGWYEHRMFKGPKDDVNLHVFSAGCPEIDRMVAFRDRLRTSARDREQYAQSKRALAQQEWTYTQDYADAKTAVIEEILSRTRNAESLYGQDLAYIHAAAFGGLASGAAPEILRRLKSAAIPVRRVIDVGCGAGPLTAALIQAGYEVTGIDSSAELLSIARTVAPNAHFVNASIYDTDIPVCEALVAVGEPLTYHAEGADSDNLLQKLFQRMSDILPPGGMLIFDVIGLGEPSLAGRSWSCGEDWAVLVETKEDQVSRTLVRNIETFRRVDHLYRRGREVHSVRLFDVGTLSGQLAGCGFATVLAHGYGTQSLAPRRRALFCTRV